MTGLFVIVLGLSDYMTALNLQKVLREKVATRSLPNILLLLEHPHVYTLGRRSSQSDILGSPRTLNKLGVSFHQVDRGGQTTYHGPGQLVGYPIINLKDWGGGPIRYVRALEEVMVKTLAAFGIPSNKDHRPTGVWAKDKKIGAVGVKISQGVSTHGFSMNINPNLSYFDHIVPCGIPEIKVTSMSDLGVNNATVESVTPILVKMFSQVFGFIVHWSDIEDVCNYPDSILSTETDAVEMKSGSEREKDPREPI